MTQLRWLLLATICLGGPHWPLQATAQETTPPAMAGQAKLFDSARIDAEFLEVMRGGAELNLYDLKSEGVVSNNQASNLTTGSNWITDGSLAGASGFSTVVQNSGNNVLIQNATIINLQVQ